MAIDEHPKDIPGIKKLIGKRKRQIRDLEHLLTIRHPRHIRSLMVSNLAGTRANLESWEIWLAKLERKSA